MKLLALFAAAGAALAYFLDPQNGKRRRHVAVDRVGGFFRRRGRDVSRTGRAVTSEAYGELWVVPRYTGKPRQEVTPEDAATLLRVLSAFPGSRVTAFHKSPAPAAARVESP